MKPRAQASMSEQAFVPFTGAVFRVGANGDILEGEVPRPRENEEAPQQQQQQQQQRGVAAMESDRRIMGDEQRM